MGELWLSVDVDGVRKEITKTNSDLTFVPKDITTHSCDISAH